MIRAEVIGDKETVAKLGSEVRAYLDNIRKAVRTIGLRHESTVKRNKLSGQVLNRRSGRLSAGVNTQINETSDAIEAVTGIGPDLFYGKMHEEGGVFTVKAHMRTITMAFGRPIAPVQVKVRQHTLTLPQRSFLRSTLREMRAKDMQTLRAAMKVK